MLYNHKSSKPVIYCFLILFAIFLVAESSIRFFHGVPPSLRKDENFYRYYIDIYEDFFVKDKDGNSYFNKRPGSVRSVFSVEKSENQKRVFVLGGSVAKDYDNKILKYKLSEVYPDYDWNIINCAMEEYDSYRLYLITKEIIKYKPDLIIVLTGNNEGIYDPVTINPLIYKNKFLSKVWIFRIIGKYLKPSIYTGNKKIIKFFESNINKICKITKENNIPLVLFTLPTNHKMPLNKNLLKDKDYFSVWWLLSQDPWIAERYVNNHPYMKRIPKYAWLLGKMYSYLKKEKSSEKYYALNVRKNKEEIDSVIRKTASEYKGSTALLDFQKTASELSGGISDFRILKDDIHFWYPVYYFLSEQIIYKLNTTYPEKFVPTENIEYDNMNKDMLFNLNFMEIDNLMYDFPYSCRNYILNLNKKGILPLREIIAFLYLRDSVSVLEFNEFKKFRKYARLNGFSDEEIAMSFSLIGDVLRFDCQYDKAYEYLDIALRSDRNNPYNYLFMGLFFYDKHQKDGADFNFKELKSLGSQFDWLTSRYLDSLLK